MKKVVNGPIILNESIAPEIYRMDVAAPEMAAVCRAGQFVELYADGGGRLLPRPISICRTDPVVGTVSFVYQVVGEGTAFFSRLVKGESLRMLGPCGNGFTPVETKNAVIVGGGIGTPPLLQLAKDLREKEPDRELTAFLGFRSNPILIAEFQEYCNAVYIATDDGSFGYHGNAISLMEETDFSCGMVYACGPKLMLKSLAKWLEDRHCAGQLSMEERMACGVGACVGCVIKTKSEDEIGWRYQKVCTDGPVFMASEVIWDE